MRPVRLPFNGTLTIFVTNRHRMGLLRTSFQKLALSHLLSLKSLVHQNHLTSFSNPRRFWVVMRERRATFGSLDRSVERGGYVEMLP